MAAALLRLRLEAADPTIAVGSAGLLEGGHPAPPEALVTMARFGADLSGHRSVQVSPELLRGADLVLGMTRRHVRELAVLDPEGFPRTFTLKELVRRAERAGPRGADEAMEDWLARVSAGRDRAALMGRSPEDDIPDPFGRSPAVFDRTADELAGLADRLLFLACPQGEQASAAPSPAGSLFPPPPVPERRSRPSRRSGADRRYRGA